MMMVLSFFYCVKKKKKTLSVCERAKVFFAFISIGGGIMKAKKNTPEPVAWPVHQRPKGVSAIQFRISIPKASSISAFAAAFD